MMISDTDNYLKVVDMDIHDTFEYVCQRQEPNSYSKKQRDVYWGVLK